MAEATLQVNKREEKGKQAAKRSRQKGFIPGILYGPDNDPTLLSINTRELFNLLHSHGRNVVVNLVLGEEKKKVKTFIYEIQHEPITGNIIHVDFKHISLKEKIHVMVPIHLEGMPEGVKNEGGIIEHVMHALEIKCLPSEIPKEIILDVAPMHIGDVIHVRDVKLENSEIISDLERTIVHVIAPKVVVVEEIEEEIAEEEEAEGIAEPEVIGKKPEEIGEKEEE